MNQENLQCVDAFGVSSGNRAFRRLYNRPRQCRQGYAGNVTGGCARRGVRRHQRHIGNGVQCLAQAVAHADANLQFLRSLDERTAGFTFQICRQLTGDAGQVQAQ